MNLLDENFENKKEDKTRKIAGIILIFIIIIIIAIVAIIAYMGYLNKNTLKLQLNGELNENLKKLLVIEEDGTVYFPIKEVASYFGYESYNGEYNNKSEKINKCYIQSENEIANFELNSNKIYKLDLTSKSTNYDYYYASKPVKGMNGILYMSSDGIEQAFNISFDYNQENKRINIYTLDYLMKFYQTQVINYGYSEISNDFASTKSILQNLLIVSNQNQKSKFGVIDTDGKTILEAKYDDIKYLPSIGEFLVTADKKVGIVSKDGSTKVNLAYDSIEIIDKDAELYVVKKNNKYGVIDFKGNTKIYMEYDEIGIDSSKFADNNIKNNYLLVDKLIPVRKDNLWGIFDKNGTKLLDFQYDSLGYIASSNKNAQNLLVIPDYNVVVVCKDDKYALINESGKHIFRTVADDIYMTVENGETKYYILVNDRKIDAEEWLDRYAGTNGNTGTNNDKKENNNTENENITNTTNENNTEDSEETQPEETTPEDTILEETQPEDIQPEETLPEEETTEEQQESIFQGDMPELR